MPHNNHTNQDEQELSPVTTKIKMVSSILTGTVALLGAMWAVDSHYAASTDLEDLRKEVNEDIRQVRIERLTDILFKLDMKKQQYGKLDPVDDAIYEKDKRALDQLQGNK